MNTLWEGLNGGGRRERSKRGFGRGELGVVIRKVLLKTELGKGGSKNLIGKRGLGA